MPGFASATVDAIDLAKYDALGDRWWDTEGPMGPLHKLNPVRVGWIRDLLTRERAASTANPGATPNSGEPSAPVDKPLRGRRILDVGCGGGLLSEALAGLGAEMVGIDPAPNNVVVAQRHADANGLAVDYRCTTVEALTAERFDAVLVMEVVEHVRDVAGFLRDCALCVRPGGLLVGATLNRTLKSYALAIVGAEYVLHWLPRGTHDWHKFVTPAEFEARLEQAGLVPFATAGVAFDPLRGRWHVSRDLGCNYMVAARRPAT